MVDKSIKGSESTNAPDESDIITQEQKQSENNESNIEEPETGEGDSVNTAPECEGTLPTEEHQPDKGEESTNTLSVTPAQQKGKRRLSPKEKAKHKEKVFEFILSKKKENPDFKNKEIAQMLNDEGVLTERGKEWSEVTYSTFTNKNDFSIWQYEKEKQADNSLSREA